MNLKDWGLLSLLSVLWGGSFFFSKLAVQELPPLTVVLVRVSVGAAALGVYLRTCGIPVPRTPAIWWAFARMGVLNNLIPFTLIFWGQTVISSGLASILNATTPVFSLLVAHFVTTDERLSASKFAGIALAFLGVIVLVGNDALAGRAHALLAILACLGAALSYGLASVFGRRFRRMGIEPTVGAFGQLTASAMLMVPVTMAVDAPWRLAVPDLTVWSSLVGLALLSTALAYIIYFRLLATAGATNTSLVTLLIPVSAILLGTIVLGERPLASQLGGMALIGIGLIAIDGRLWALPRQRGPVPERH